MASSIQVKIALTGGGTAGHVIPHFALLPYFAEEGWQVFYLGSAGMEKALVEQKGLPFYCIQSGKLRRYFSWQNFVDVFKVALGFGQALLILARQRPKLVFSKGGFVSVPVAMAAKVLGIPVVTHESDLSPGLATKIIAKVASKVFYSFPETASYLAKAKAEWTGTPIRADLLQGQREEGFRLCRFDLVDSKPVVLVMGGSLGAQRLNAALQESLDSLLSQYRIVHLSGRGKSLAISVPGYAAFEYVHEELKHLLAMADLVVSRAGANSLFELLALRKPMLLIPLEIGSRGDQLHNALCFAKNGWAKILREEQLNAQTLKKSIAQTLAETKLLQAKQEQVKANEAALKIFSGLKALIG